MAHRNLQSPPTGSDLLLRAKEVVSRLGSDPASAHPLGNIGDVEKEFSTFSSSLAALSTLVRHCKSGYAADEQRRVTESEIWKVNYAALKTSTPEARAAYKAEAAELDKKLVAESVKKYLLINKDYASSSSTLQKTSLALDKSLEKCDAMINDPAFQQMSSEMAPVASSPFPSPFPSSAAQQRHSLPPPIRHRVSRLQMLADELSMQFAFNEQDLAVYMSSEVIEIEIHLSSSSLPHFRQATLRIANKHQGSASFRHYEAFDTELLDLLQREDYSTLSKKLLSLNRICKSTLLPFHFLPFDSLEADIISQFESNMQSYKSPLHYLLSSSSHYHHIQSFVGIPQQSMSGLQLAFWVDPSLPVLFDDSASSLQSISIDSIFNAAVPNILTGSITMEATSTPRRIARYPLLKPISNMSDTWIPSCPLQYVLELHQPIPCSLRSVHALLSLSQGAASHLPWSLSFSSPAASSPHIDLLEIIFEKPLSEVLSKPNTMGLHAADHVISFASGAGPGLLVHRIPFADLDELTAALYILRKQADYNLLLRNCCSSVPVSAISSPMTTAAASSSSASASASAVDQEPAKKKPILYYELWPTSSVFELRVAGRFVRLQQESDEFQALDDERSSFSLNISPVEDSFSHPLLSSSASASSSMKMDDKDPSSSSYKSFNIIFEDHGYAFEEMQDSSEHDNPLQVGFRQDAINRPIECILSTSIPSQLDIWMNV